MRFNRRVCLITFTSFFAFGMLFWAGFNTAIEVTNTESFCITCHEMKSNVYQEYKQTKHYMNSTGVRATCPDCHVPREWPYKVLRKIRATNELYHAFRGTIDTPEKFQAKRLELARDVWRTMEETDSRECRNCHGFDYMDLYDQGRVASEKHRQADQEGRTCIECHQGISHHLPEEYVEAEHERYESEDVPCADCHEDIEEPPEGEDWDWDKED